MKKSKQNMDREILRTMIEKNQRNCCSKSYEIGETVGDVLNLLFIIFTFGLEIALLSFAVAKNSWIAFAGFISIPILIWIISKTK